MSFESAMANVREITSNPDVNSYFELAKGLPEWVSDLSEAERDWVIAEVGQFLDSMDPEDFFVGVAMAKELDFWPPFSPLLFEISSNDLKRASQSGVCSFPRATFLLLNPSSIDISWIDVGSFELPKLKKIRIISPVEKGVIHWLCQQDLPSLKEFSPLGGIFEEEALSKCFRASWFANLQELRFGNVPPNDLSWLPHRCTSLALYLSNMEKIGEIISQCPMVENLEVLPGMVHGNIWSVLTLESLPYLRRLTVVSEDLVGIEKATSMSILTHLNLQYPALEDGSMFPFAIMTSLQSLILHGCRLTTVSEMVKVNWPDLSHLDLRYNPIRDLKTLPDASWWPNLTFLGLINTGINETTLKYLLDARGPALKKIHVAGYEDGVNKDIAKKMCQEYGIRLA
jgi:hypothetical protein